jgi:hypothetical protein
MGSRLVTRSVPDHKKKRVQNEVVLLHAPSGIRKQSHCFRVMGNSSILRQCDGLREQTHSLKQIKSKVEKHFVLLS